MNFSGKIIQENNHRKENEQYQQKLDEKIEKKNMAQRRMQTERLHDISKYIKRILFLCLTLI
jgi:hypothetical protein